MATDSGSRPSAQATEAELRRHLDSILDEAQRLRSDVHGAEVARKRANLINSVVLIVLAGFVAMLFAVVVQANRTAAQAAQTNRQVADCTTAGGTCYEEGRRRTSQAISDILKVSIYMAECARLYPGEAGPEYDRKLEACVYERLERDRQPQPSASPPG